MRRFRLRRGPENVGCLKVCRWCSYCAVHPGDPECRNCGISYEPGAKPRTWKHRFYLWRLRFKLRCERNFALTLQAWSWKHPWQYRLALVAVAFVVYAIGSWIFQSFW